jgi:hypothetical protein
MEWEKRAAYRSCNGIEPTQRSSHKAVEVPFPMATLEMARNDWRPATIFFQMGVSRKWESPKL